jgi:hypothetical protein
LTGAGDGNAVAPTTGKTKRVSVYSSAGILLQSITVSSNALRLRCPFHLIMLTRPTAVGSHLTDRKDRMDCERKSSHSRKRWYLSSVSNLIIREHRKFYHFKLHQFIIHLYRLFPALTLSRCARRYHPRCQNIRKRYGSTLIYVSIHTR